MSSCAGPVIKSRMTLCSWRPCTGGTHPRSSQCWIGWGAYSSARADETLISNRISLISVSVHLLVPTATRIGPYTDTVLTLQCCWTLPCASSLAPSVLHLSHGFQCSPTLNCQPYKGRLPLTSWWRKSSNMTVGQSSLISLTHHCCGWTCNQLTSKVDGGITGSRLRWSTLTWCVTPQSGNKVLTSLGNSGLYWTVLARSEWVSV